MRWMTGLLLPLLAGCSVVAVGPFPRASIPAAIAVPAQQRQVAVARALDQRLEFVARLAPLGLGQQLARPLFGGNNGRRQGDGQIARWRRSHRRAIEVACG